MDGLKKMLFAAFARSVESVLPLQALINVRLDSRAINFRRTQMTSAAPLCLSGAALLVAANLEGWVGTTLEADDIGLTLAIFGVFVGGVAISVR